MKYSKPIHWGIVGTGMVANHFANGLRLLPGSQLLAISSRQESTAKIFASQHDVPRTFVGHQSLASDPDIDVVYIGTPHPTHKQIALDCIEAGKAILIEKPFALNEQEAQIIVNKAREKGVFCMEAMWMRFIPLIQRVKNIVTEDALGENLLLNATLGFRSPFSSENRFFNLKLGGGALLDAGVYPINLAFWLLGKPNTIKSYLKIGQTGVDELGAFIFGYQNGSLAVLSTGNRIFSFNQASIQGEKGRLQIYEPIYSPTRMKIDIFQDSKSSSKVRQIASQLEWLRKMSRRVRTLTSRLQNSDIYMPITGNGYQYEAEEVEHCIRNGQLESNIMPLNETLDVLSVMDEIRKQWDFFYPVEKQSKVGG
ncbi:MAG: Gfo/Idh/MocA family oxidoreductase [Ardenticatenaceae bacterium]|nr:Gfo/Idh/MocA family oxidoreductase [Ardenticatenaceae bacterium]